MTVKLQNLSLIDNQRIKIKQFSVEIIRNERIALGKITLENNSFKIFTPESGNDIFIKQHDKHLKSGSLSSTIEMSG